MSKTVPELPSATTPLNSADLLMVWQASGGLKKVAQDDAMIDGVEVISNVNGRAYRFPSGLQLCYHEDVISYFINVPAVGTQTILWTFPAAFSATSSYLVIGQQQTSSEVDGQRARVVSVARRENRTASSCNIFYEVTTLTLSVVRIGAFAIGFWES